jgi:hypothetical protein
MIIQSLKGNRLLLTTCKAKKKKFTGTEKKISPPCINLAFTPKTIKNPTGPFTNQIKKCPIMTNLSAKETADPGIIFQLSP